MSNDDSKVVIPACDQTEVWLRETDESVLIVQKDDDAPEGFIAISIPQQFAKDVADAIIREAGNV